MNIKPYLYIANEKVQKTIRAVKILMEHTDLGMADARNEVSRQAAEFYEETKDLSPKEHLRLMIQGEILLAEEKWDKTKETPTGGVYYLGQIHTLDKILREVNSFFGDV